MPVIRVSGLSDAVPSYYAGTYLSSCPVVWYMAARHCRFCKDRAGVAGYFEDIPALIVVIVGLGIFMASVTNAFVYYTGRQYVDEPDEGRRLLDNVLSYHGIKRNGYKDGTFDRAKLRNITIDRIKRDILTELEFRIYIEDVSDYPDRENFTFETSPGTGGDLYFFLTYRYPVNIFTSLDMHQTQTAIHPAVLTLSVWR